MNFIMEKLSKFSHSPPRAFTDTGAQMEKATISQGLVLWR